MQYVVLIVELRIYYMTCNNEETLSIFRMGKYRHLSKFLVLVRR